MEKLVDNFEKIAQSLKQKFEIEKRNKSFVPSKEVLTLLAGGLLLAASIIMPGLASGLKMFITDKNNSYDKKEWKKFNTNYLAKTIRRLEKQKFVEILNEGNLKIVKITKKGRKRILKYALNEIEIKKPRTWNGNWYFVTYDIPKNKDRARNIMRDYLKRLGFYQFQESLYIHAYPCENEIDFIKEYLGINECVKVLIANKIENDRVFREYFGI